MLLKHRLRYPASLKGESQMLSPKERSQCKLSPEPFSLSKKNKSSGVPLADAHDSSKDVEMSKESVFEERTISEL